MILSKPNTPERWFAWHPVAITNGAEYAYVVWVQFVWRQRISSKYPWHYAITRSSL